MKLAIQRTYKEVYSTIFVAALIICSINFFDLQILRGSFVRYIQFGFLLGTIAISFIYFFVKNSGFIFPVKLISFSILLSIFIANLTWNQDLGDCITGTIPVLIWVVFFYLRYLKYPISSIEKLIIGYGILYIIFYFFQFTHADKSYFINTEEIDVSGGITRIVFPGRGIFYLTVFMAINKLTCEKNNRWFWCILSILGIVITIMQVTRQFIFGIAIIYLFHFLKNQNISKQILVTLLVAFSFFYVSQSDSPIIKGLMKTQSDDLQSGSNYIRLKEAAFFLEDYPYSKINSVLGMGVAYGDNSKYYKYSEFYQDYYGYYLSDVGLIAVYVMFGVFAVLGYLMIWVKSFRLRIPEKYLYLKYYLSFLIFTCLTSDTIYGTSDLISTILVVYSFQTIYEAKNEQLIL